MCVEAGTCLYLLVSGGGGVFVNQFLYFPFFEYCWFMSFRSTCDFLFNLCITEPSIFGVFNSCITEVITCKLWPVANHVAVAN